MWRHLHVIWSQVAISDYAYLVNRVLFYSLRVILTLIFFCRMLFLVCWAGYSTTVTSLKTLDRGNYTIQVLLQDQQGKYGTDELNVFVCDCGDGDECQGLRPITTQLGGPAIGALIAGLLLLLREYCIFLTLVICSKSMSLSRLETYLSIYEKDMKRQIIKFDIWGPHCRSPAVVPWAPIVSIAVKYCILITLVICWMLMSLSGL